MPRHSRRGGEAHDLVPSGAGLAASLAIETHGAEREAACHDPLERWPMSGEEIRRADEAVAAG